MRPSQPRRTTPRPRIKRGEQLWLAPAGGEARTDVVAEIAPRLASHQTLTYAVPESMRELVRPGSRVLAPYGAGGRVIQGWVLSVSEQPWDHTRRALGRVLDAQTLLDEELIELARWVATYYFCPPARVLDGVVPARFRRTEGVLTRVVRLLAGQPVEPGKELPRRQRRVVEALQGGPAALRDVLKQAECARSTIETLRRKGVLEIVAERRPSTLDDATEPAQGEPAAATPPAAAPEDDYALTAGQTGALQAIQRAAAGGGFGVHLLYGVPGSGKTEVYVRAIRAVAAAGREALLLVPEIALATQIVDRLARRFGRVAILHSRLTAKARGDTLTAIAAGRFDVVIGTRSAVFAPLRRLGLIVVDEEQETSYKNLAAPFYHTRDVAIKRAQIAGVPVVLGSATPALETWHNAQTRPHYHLLELPERVPGAEVPKARLVNVERPQLGQTTRLLSPELAEALQATLAAGHQAILLHNRRGYALTLRCVQCGLEVMCEQCGTRMIFHRGSGGASPGDQVKCHRCGRHSPAPRQCPDDSCGGELERTGGAIQRLEAELVREFPNARLLRLDRDTMRKREDYARALSAFEAHQADILLGTQMVAKGLDFPEARLVGVLDADAGLALPDFRAHEHTFQLLMQVVGRAGRRQGESLALIQTARPETSLLQLAVRLDYRAFAAAELPVRAAGHEPPFMRLTRILCLDPNGGAARRAAETLAAALRELAATMDARIRIDAPQPAPIARLRGLHRWQILIRTPAATGGRGSGRAAPGADSARLLRAAQQARLLRPRIERLTVDVDPVEMM